MVCRERKIEQKLKVNEEEIQGVGKFPYLRSIVTYDLNCKREEL